MRKDDFFCEKNTRCYKKQQISANSNNTSSESERLPSAKAPPGVARPTAVLAAMHAALAGEFALISVDLAQKKLYP